MHRFRSVFFAAITAVLLLSPAIAAAQAAPKPPAQAADLTGTWIGSFVMTMDGGESREDVAHMVLKQTGKELTGTAGPDTERQWQIVKGKIDGAKVTFEVMADGPVISFDLTLVDGHLKGTAKAEADGRSMSAVVDLQRKAS